MDKNKEMFGFPDEFASLETKKSPEYGYKISTGIFREMDEIEHSGNYQGRLRRYSINESLAMGKQGADQYKPMMGDHEGTSEFMQLFWKETNVLPKYKNLAVKLLTENKYKAIATSYDPISKTQKDKIKAKLVGNMKLKKLEETVLKNTGVKLLKEGDVVPRGGEEVELYSEMSFKSSLEIAIELAIECVLGNNDFETIRKRTANSLVVNKWAARYLGYDENGDICIEHIPEEDLIVHYSNDEYFKKRKWTGHIKRMTISELRIRNNDKGMPIFSNEELFDIARKHVSKNGNGSFGKFWDSNDRDQRWNNFLVDILCFEYNTCIERKWSEKDRKKGGKIVERVTKNKGSYSKNKTIHKREKQVYFDGMWVIGSDRMLEYGLRENMSYDNGTGLGNGKPLSRYIITAPGIKNMENKSIAETSEGYIHQMHLAHLKFQQILTEIAPPETAVDVNALQGVIEGLGLKGGKPADIMKMRKQLGVWFYRSKTSHGKLLNQNPIKEIQHRYDGTLQEIAFSYNHNLKLLQDEIGLNDVIAGTNQNQYEGLQSRQIKISAGVKSISDIGDALDWMDEQTLKVAAFMIQDTIARGDKIEGFEKAIGKANVDLIEIQGAIPLAEVGIELEFLPTVQQLESLDRDIEWAQKQDLIRFEDAQFIKMIAPTNFKRAIRIMGLRREIYKKDKMEETMALSQQNAKGQQQTAAMVKQAEAQQEAVGHERKKEMAMLENMLKLKEQREGLKDDAYKINLEQYHEKQKINLAKDNNLDKTEISNPVIDQPKVF